MPFWANKLIILTYCASCIIHLIVGAEVGIAIINISQNVYSSIVVVHKRNEPCRLKDTAIKTKIDFKLRPMLLGDESTIGLQLKITIP